MSVKKFMSIFDGLQQAYGYFRIDKESSSGKSVGKAGILREPRTKELWERHLSGTGNGLGIIPINEDNSCKWGCIDIDQYPLDHTALIDKIRKLKLPLVVCRSKSGGAHCFLFSKDWVDAKDFQKALKDDILPRIASERQVEWRLAGLSEQENAFLNDLIPDF